MSVDDGFEVEGDEMDCDEQFCTWCGGDGTQETDDPLWDGVDEHGNPAIIKCVACGGSGLRKHQTIF